MGAKPIGIDKFIAFVLFHIHTETIAGALIIDDLPLIANTQFFVGQEIADVISHVFDLCSKEFIGKLPRVYRHEALKFPNVVQTYVVWQAGGAASAEKEKGFAHASLRVVNVIVKATQLRPRLLAVIEFSPTRGKF